MRPLAVLRPEPGNTATMARIEALGRQAIRLPLFEIRALDWTPPDPAGFDALVLTSANAVRFAGPALDRFRHLPVLAVGRRTADAAVSGGFHVEAVGETDGQAVMALANRHGLSRVLHVAGRDRAIGGGGPIAATVSVYANVALPITAERLRALEGSVALLHSIRAASHLGDLVAKHRLARTAIGIGAFSPAIAAAAGPGWASIAIADAPRDATLIAACARD